MISKLELKILPALLIVVFILLMWWLAILFPTTSAQNKMAAILSLTLLVIAVAFVLAAAISFRAEKTTVNPTKPHTSSALVTSGIYTYTRNPMYVGFVCVLIAWGIYLMNIYSLMLIPGFILYMNRFQILPEERALEKLFGEVFLAYKKRVRRWL